MNRHNERSSQASAINKHAFRAGFQNSINVMTMDIENKSMVGTMGRGHWQTLRSSQINHTNSNKNQGKLGGAELKRINDCAILRIILMCFYPNEANQK